MNTDSGGGVIGGGGAFDSIVGMIGIDIFYLVLSETTYSATASRDNRSVNVSIKVTSTTIQDRFGNTLESIGTTVSVELTNNSLTDRESAIVKNVAKTATEIALRKKVDVAIFLGIVQGESEFGIAKQTDSSPKKDPAVNPSQFSGGRARSAYWGSSSYQTALEYNLAGSIDQVFFWAQEIGRKRDGIGGKSSIWWMLFYWNGSTRMQKNGIEERVNFANRVETIIGNINGTRHQESRRTGWFESRGIPNVTPLYINPCVGEPFRGC